MPYGAAKVTTAKVSTRQYPSMPDRLTWTSRDVASAFGRSLWWFQQHRAALEEVGFPKPLPLRMGYDPEAVRSWIRHQDPTQSPPANPVDDWAAELDRRAAVLGTI